MAYSDQQRSNDDPSHRLDGQRATADRRAVGCRRGLLRAGLRAGRGRDGVLYRGRRVAVP